MVRKNRSGHLHRAYNEKSALEVRTFIGAGGADGPTRIERRTVDAGLDDPAPCRDVHLAAMDSILSGLADESEAGRAARLDGLGRLSISGTAEEFGLGSRAAREAARAFEDEPGMRVGALARQLGCSRRTLHRRLAEDGVGAEALKMACMLVGAMSMLASSKTLTDIAHESGYSDLAHMTRAFKSSCELPPSAVRSAVRSAIRGDAMERA